MERITLRKAEDDPGELDNFERRPLIEDNTMRRHSNPVLVAMAGVVESVLNLHIDSYIYYFFKCLFPVIYMICCTYWTGVNSVWGTETGIERFMNELNKLLTFSVLVNSTAIDYVQVIVPLVLTLIHFIVTVVLLRLYLKKLSVSKRVMMLAAIWFEILPLFLMMPNLAAFASTIVNLSRKDPVAIVFFLIYICVNVYSCFVAYCSLLLTSYALKPSISLLSVVDGTHYFVLMLGCGACMLIANVTEITKGWTFVFAVIPRLCIVLYLIIDVFNMIHAKKTGAAICLGMYFAMISFDIMAVVDIFGRKVAVGIKFAVPILVFIVISISGYFVIHRIRCRIAAKLDCRYKDREKVTEYYEGLQIKNYKQAIKYVIVGFTEGVPRVLDGTFPHIVAKKFDNYSLYQRVAEFTLMLPCNNSCVADSLDWLSSVIQQTLMQKLILNHLNSIQSGRFQRLAQETDILFMELKNEADSAIELTKRFWYEVAIKNERSAEKTVQMLAAMIPKVKQRWKEILLLHPGEPDLALTYSRFCIECLGKFETGVIYNIRSKYIEQGYQASLDPLFRAFVISQPKLWREKIVDRTGQIMLKYEDCPSAQFSSSATETTTLQDKLQDDVDFGALDSAARDLMEWPRLRMNVTKATSHYRPPLLMTVRICKKAGLLAWSAALIAAIVLYVSAFTTMQYSYERCEAVNICRAALSYMRNFIFLIYANQTGILFSNEQYESIIPKVNWNTISSLYYYRQPEISLKNVATTALDSFIFLYKSFARSGLGGENVTRIASMIADPVMTRTRYRATGEELTTHTSAKSAFLSIFWTYQSFLNTSRENYAGFLTSKELLDTSVAHMILSEYLSSVCDDFATQAQEAFFTRKSEMVITISIIVVTGCLILIPLTHLPQIIIMREYNKIQKALLQVRSEDATKATHPIIMHSGGKNEISPLQSLSNNDRSFMMILVISSILSLVIVVITGCTLIVFMAYGQKAMRAVAVSRFGSMRDAWISEIFGYVIMLLTLKEKTTDAYTREDVTLFYQRALAEFNVMKEKFAHGDGDKPGIYELDPKIREFHITDKCASNASGGISFSFYSCLSLERSMSTFFVYSEDLALESNAYTLKSELFVNYLHFVTGVLEVHLRQSRTMVLDFVMNRIRDSQVGTTVMLVVAILLVIVNWFLKFYLEGRFMGLLKTVLILLRRLPPPVIATTPVITDALIVTSERTKSDMNDPGQLLFHYSQAPMLSLSANLAIESINQAFSNIFHFADDHIIGQSLPLVIHRPLAGDNEQTPEEQGAFHLYDKMERMVREGVELACTYPVEVHCGDGTTVSTDVTVHPVQTKAGEIKQFVLIAEDKRELVVLENKIKEDRKDTKYLGAKLVPMDLSPIFETNGYDYVHTVECATLVTVHVKEMMYLINDTEHAVAQLNAELNAVCEMFPPFIKYITVFDAFFFIGGLVPDETKNHADIGLKFAVELKKVIHRIVPRKTHQRYALSVVTGGPVSCVLIGDPEQGNSRRFDLVSEILDDGAALVALAPPNTIIISTATAQRLTEVPVTLSGPNFKDMPTLLL